MDKNQKTNIDKTPWHKVFNRGQWGHFLIAALLTGGITFIGQTFLKDIGTVNLALLFLLPVIYSALNGGRRHSFATAVLCMLLYDYLFVHPFFSFSVSDIRYLLSFFVFIFVGTVIGTITSELNEQTREAKAREIGIRALYTLSEKMAERNSLEGMMTAVCQIVTEITGCESRVFTVHSGREVVLLSERNPAESKAFLRTEEAAIRHAFENHQAVLPDTIGAPNNQGHYLPLIANDRCYGVLGLYGDLIPQREMDIHGDFVHTVVNQAATAVSRYDLAQKAEEAHLLRASEKLHTAILNSVSHDLHTPLTAIIGSVSGLLKDRALYSPEDEEELLLTIDHEAKRMNRLVNNLLEMTRLESGTLELKKQWYDLEDIIGVSQTHLGTPALGRTVKVEIPDDFPMVYCDYVLMEQVVRNLLDNALKYAPDYTEIRVWAERDSESVSLNISNATHPLSQNDADRIFEKFYRGTNARKTVGSGLGLAICKGFVEAHGGRIHVNRESDNRIVMEVRLPIPEQSGKILGFPGGDHKDASENSNN